MAVRFTEIWLLIGVVFVVELPVTRGQLCPSDQKFHALTRSCMALISTNYVYGQAKYYCQEYFRSSTTKTDGHLVYIFDQDTDDFVKGLLDEQGVDRALIGLHDRAGNGVYGWGDHKAIAAGYMGWEDNPHTPVSNKHAVVMTKDGWQEYDGRSAAYFVCQVSVDFPTPNMECPVAEVGQESPDIRCTTNIRQPFAITHVRFEKTTEVVASCNDYTCSLEAEYEQDVNVSKSPETGSPGPWTLKLRNVKISDATGWSCSVEFNNIGYWVAGRPCSLNVYRKPADIQCSHQFVQATVRTTCTAAQVYPQVDCSWRVNYLKWTVTVYGQAESNGGANADGYYGKTCTASFNVNNAGTYNVTVIMVPRLSNFRIEGVKETSVSVASPQDQPQLYLAGQILQSLSVAVVENQTLALTCRVPGGNPQAYRTMITCDNIPQPFESDGSSVNASLRVTRAFNGRNCTCSALHAASYTQTSSVEIRVIYPATVTSFGIARRYSISTDINKGDQITFTCRADGNPMSQVIVQRQNGRRLTNSSTDDITYHKTATCSDTGSYVCLASNMVQGQHHQDSRVAHLQVRCAPEYCNGTSSPEFPAAVGAPSASIKMCVRAYPAPTSFSLYKGKTTNNRLKADKFQAYFNFTSDEDGLGEITVMISPFTQADIGDYMVYSDYRLESRRELYSYLTFSVFAQGPPMCPTNLSFVKADPDSVTLSWKPGFDGGLNQTFTVLRIDSPSDTASPGFTMLGTVEGQEDGRGYAVTGLSDSTTYTFGLEVRNEKGSGNCSHLQVTVSTSASPSALGGAVVTVVVVPAITVLLLVILVVGVVVVIRRRRGHMPKKSVYMSDTARTGAGDTSRAGTSGAGDTSRLASNDNGGDNVYANTPTPGISREDKNVKAAKKTNEEEDDSNTYAQVNKQDKKAKKAIKRPDKKKASEQGQESLYSRFARNINLKGHKKGNTEHVYNELADVYQNVSNAGVPDTSAAADTDNVYANVKVSSPNKQEKKKDIQRTVNDDGLVYVSVEINKKTTYPEIVSVKKPVGTVSPMTTNAEPEVEYIAINYSPRVKQQ